MERPLPAQRYRFGEYVLEPREARLLRGGNALDVQPKVIELLRTFVAKPGHLFTREDLMRALWPDVHVSDHSLSQVLHKTRQALGDDGGETGWIQTVHRKGYRFVGAVAAESGPAPVESPVRDRFVGRAPDLEALDRAWAQHAAGVLLVGPGGAGKTRLAREHLERVRTPWHHVVDLTGVRTPDALVGALATALGVPLQAADTAHAVEQVGFALEHRGQGLVLLDNLEGVLPGGASHLARWRALAPDVRWLLTSRVRVEIDGVSVHEVPPLDEADGVTLFLDRARERSIALGAGWNNEIRDIARRLEGSPLAIELAAARTTLLDPAAIRDRLDRQLALLGSPRGEAPARGLRAVVAWSWELATEPERATLAHLAVFPAAFTLAQAEAVVRPGPGALPVLEIVEGLVERFLVADGSRGLPPAPGRLRLPPPVREFALERLDPADGAWGRFVAVMCERAAEAQDLTDVWDADRHAGLMLDVDNLVAALDRCDADPSSRARLAAGLGQLLVASGRAVEARGLLARVDASTDLGPDEAARTLYWLATAETSLGMRSSLGPRLGQAAAAARERGEQALASDLAERRGELLYIGGSHEEALAVAQEAIALAEAAGDLRRVAAGAYRAAVPTLYLGRRELGEGLVARGLAGARSARDPRLLSQLLDLRAALATQAGRPDEALRDSQEALAMAREARLGARELLHLVNISSANQEAGRFAEALEQQDEVVERYGRLGQRLRQGLVLGNRALTRLHLGDLDGAEADLLAAMALTEEGSMVRRIITMNRAALEALRGRFDHARDLGRTSLEDNRGSAVMASAALLWVIVAEAGRGDLAAARAAVDEARGFPPVPPLLVESHAVAAALVDAREATDLGEPADPTPIDRGLASPGHPLVALVARACRVALAAW